MTALRWKKEPPERGLRRVIAGPQSSSLWVDVDAETKVRAAMVSTHGRSPTQWYWVAGWAASQHGVPHKNTCAEPPLTEVEAKAAAMAYVKQHLSAPNKKGSQ